MNQRGDRGGMRNDFGSVRRILGTLVVSVFLGSLTAWAADVVPPCPAYNHNLPINNEQVLHWKRTTPNQFRERAHIEGPVVQVYPDKNGHQHFEIQVGKYAEDTIEVIYNKDFGPIPTPAIGMMVEACGDYITSTAQSGAYPPSPAGAIIHWIHMNPAMRGHDPGFLMMDGSLYGQDAEHAGPPTYPKNQKTYNNRQNVDDSREYSK